MPKNHCFEHGQYWWVLYKNKLKETNRPDWAEAYANKLEKNMRDLDGSYRQTKSS